jgi:AraC family transcriptional regulator, regulatory protein of adaptative response / methylated-DNA-[protein]-cysteine methyltransferase
MNEPPATARQKVPANGASDYARIEKAIAYLQAHFLEQPDLSAAAKSVHLSEYHFQRLFTRWAGISPKRFLQFLTVEHAKRQLARSRAVLDAALDSGLSGPGRLHDLFVAVEAVTPGEFKTRGAGIEIRYGFHPTPFGLCLLGVTHRGICWLGFAGNSGRRGALSTMRSHWSGAVFAEDCESTSSVIGKIFSKLTRRGNTSLSLLLMGTNFQLKVWQALLRIPPGSVVSYEAVGEMIHAKNSSRAIGSAIGANCVAYLIPCHRVIRKTGLQGGYRWGAPRKGAMLAWESARPAA